MTAAVADAQFWAPGSTARAELTDVVARAVHALGYRGEKPKKNDPPLTVEALKALLEAKGGLPAMTPEVTVAVEQARESMVVKWGPVELKADQRRKRLGELLDALADEVEVRPGPEPLVVRRHSARYNTTDDAGYARRRCQIDAHPWLARGVRCDVVADAHGSAARAWVEGELDVEVLRRVGVSFREFVRLCWKLGSNPRVYLPTLPHGFEEQQGLDYFGADLRVKGPSGQSQEEVDAEGRRVSRAAELVFDVETLQRVRAGVWRGETRGRRPFEALPLVGLVAFDWRDAEGSVRTRAVYDIGSPVAGPIRVDGKILQEESEAS